MEKSRLISLFTTLIKSELKDLGKFVRSPYFNQQENLVGFFDYLVECKQQLEIIPTKQQVFQKLFPHQKFSDVKIRLLMSDLHKLIERYLICKSRFLDEVDNKMQLAQIYRQRNLPKHFQKTIKSANEFWKKNNFEIQDILMINMINS